MVIASEIPTQTGKVALVTGATSGIGLATAAALARAGATVIMAGRNIAKGASALRTVGATSGSAVFERVDQSDMADVRRFAAAIRDRYRRLDILVNNAGLLAPRARQTTCDGFELQFGVNTLSHFLLTAELIPLLRAVPHARIVWVTSLVHRYGRIAFEDLQGARHYGAYAAYAQSKLAMLMFALELRRRSAAIGSGLVSVAAHPGWARTDLFAGDPGSGAGRPVQRAMLRALQPFLSHSAEAGAAPLILAATAPDLLGGSYLGPTGFLETRGPPGVARIAKHARDRDVAARLWSAAAALTGADPGFFGG